MSRETIQKILGKTETGRSADSAARDAGDAADPLEATYIDVTLYAVEKQTKTAVISARSDLNMTFDEVPVGASVYAKAKIYKYLDAGLTLRDVIYNGESSRIIVHNGPNALNLKLAGAMLTITFNSNGGSSVSSKKVATGTTVEKPADPVKPVKKEKYSRDDNNAFEGWYTDSQLTKAFDFSTTITDDMTLYAKWLKDFVFVEGDVVTDYLTSGRNVTIGDLFVSDHEVTQAEYKAVTNSNPSQFHFDDEEPVENVTWFDAIKYCNLLSIQEGLTPCYKVNNSTDPENWGTLTPTTQVVCNLSARGYRLPTEAEWEYIATKAERNKPLSSMAMYSANSEGRPQKVKTPLADELYLCDLLGNVAEWCFDVYSTSISASTGKTGPAATATENSRVVRGGAYNSPASECAKDVRSSADPTIASSSTGFRVVRSAIDEFAIVTNTVTFLTNGGSAVATQYIVEGETASRPADPTRTGYSFAGWLYNGSVFDFDTIIAQDIVLEAEWSLINYTINYVLGEGATNASTNPSTYTIETETFNLQDPTRDSYNFMGWYNEDVDPDLRITRIEKGSYGNITLTAHWTQCFVVTFNTNGGSSVSTQAVEDQSCATEPGAPTKPGYDFGGWYTDSTFNNGFSFTTPISDNITLYAKWNPRSDTNYYIKHYKQKTIGSEYELAETETRQGTTDQPTTISSSDAKTYTGFNVSSTNIIQNVTITGNGEAVVNIYYDRLTFQVKYDDGVTTETISVPSAETYRYGATVNIDFTSIGTRPGYTFAGWNDGSTTYTSSGTTSFIMDLSAVTLTAVWTANTNTPYTVKYFFQNVDCDASATPTVSDYLSNTAYPATTSYGTTGTTTSVSAPSVSGFTVSTVNPIQNKTISGDGSTVVNVYYDRVKKTVTYTANQTGVSNPASQTYLYGQPITLDFSIATAAPGYDFNGWKDNNSGTVYTSGSTLTMGTSNISLIGQWTVHNFSITYLPEGVMYSGGSDTYNINTPGTCPTSVDDNDGVFGGWYLASDYSGTGTPSGTPITEVSQDTVGGLDNVMLYAYFTKTIYVQADGLSSNTGLNPSVPVDTIEKAIEKIVALSRNTYDWNIAICGTVVEQAVIDNASLTTSVAKSLTLTGNGTNATLDGGSLTTGDNRTTLTINTTFPITITNLRITGGRGTKYPDNYFYGGGLYLYDNAVVKLGDGAMITGNACDHGGGVFVGGRDAKLFMYDASYVGDPSKTAASEANLFTGRAYDNALYANSAWSSTAGVGYGGGILNYGSVYLGYSDVDTPVELTGGIYGNAAFVGGGIYNGDGDSITGSLLVMNTGNITQNVADKYYDNTLNFNNAYGGGVYNYSTFILNGGTLSENKAKNVGGAIFNSMINSSNLSVLTMNDGTISSNTAPNSTGGGVYNSGNFTMIDGSFEGNIASSGGAAISVYGTFTMKGGSITNCRTSTSTKERMSAICCSNATVTLDGAIYMPYELNSDGKYAGHISTLNVITLATEFYFDVDNYTFAFEYTNTIQSTDIGKELLIDYTSENYALDIEFLNDGYHLDVMGTIQEGN